MADERKNVTTPWRILASIANKDSFDWFLIGNTHPCGLRKADTTNLDNPLSGHNIRYFRANGCFQNMHSRGARDNE